MKTKILLFSVLFFFSASAINAQVYNACKGQNAVYDEVVDDKTGDVKYVPVQTDQHGNAAGSQYDLAVDGAFQGETIAVLHLYTGEGFDFSLPLAALKQKGFGIYRWMNAPPPPDSLKKVLDQSCQLWIISNTSQMLNAQHLEVIKEFFDAGHGVYIWGDNQPYYADANYVANALFGGMMLGNYYGNETVGLKDKNTISGLMPQHLITTGLQYVYEGITIATIQENQMLQPLIYNSEGNIVAAYYEHDCKRAILDGGFTRLYIAWDNAGTGRYVKNAAAWLVNYERFGEK